MSSVLLLLRVDEERVFHAQRAFFTHMGFEALVEPCYASVAFGCRCNGHGSSLVLPRALSAKWASFRIFGSGEQVTAQFHIAAVRLLQTLGTA